MTQLAYDNEGHWYATVGTNTVEVDSNVWGQTVRELARSYYDHGMNWDESQTRAVQELSEAEAWFSPHMEGVKINGQTYTDVFQSKVVGLVREGHITREPIFNQGIAVKYLKDEYQPIALAELDRQGK